MARGSETLLAFFEIQVRGVRLYQCDREACFFGTPVRFRRDPSNPYDSNCVEVMLGGRKLGHVARRFARWLSLLLQGPFGISG